MTWFTPATLAVDDIRGAVPPANWASRPVSSGLGSSVAGPWSWSVARVEHRRERPPITTISQAEGVRLRAPRDVLARMAGAAGALGRSESDVWVEAAREWLLRHAPESPTGGPPALSGAASPYPFSATGTTGAGRTAGQAAPSVRRARVWRDIDGVLASLREQTPGRHGAPGAA